MSSFRAGHGSHGWLRGLCAAALVASTACQGARPEPADEDHVLECVMPGLRLAQSQGAVVHPRVIVATA